MDTLLNPDLKQWLEQNGLKVASVQTCSGGCISDTLKLHLQNGERLFVKQLEDAPADLFEAEAEGLRALQANCPLTVPKVIQVAQQWLLLEDLQSAKYSEDFWERLGHGLAELHKHQAPFFGFACDNYCGATPQANPQYHNGYDFFAEQRILFQTKLARDQQLLNQKDAMDIERLCARLEQLIPEQSPALIHGDLWSGNVVADREGNPALIDPASYWGWPEADIAMTTLFGGFDQHMYAHYQDVRTLEAGWENRLPLYNLYHLLNHLNLFGASYLSSVTNTIHRYL